MKRFVAGVLCCFLSLAPSFGANVPLPADVSAERFALQVLWKGFRELPPSKRPRIVLVLGGGGARGLAHIGVLRVLEEEGIPIDEIVGVSVGALIGALYASGLSVEKIEQMANQVGWNKLTDFSKASMARLVFSEQLLSMDATEKYLNRFIGNKNFSDLNIPFACVATDIRNGEKVVFREGPVVVAARASATIPALFKPVEYRHRLLVDGGLVDNLPIGEVSDSAKPYDIVIGVLPKGETRSIERGSVFQSLLRSIEIQKDIIQNEKKRDADFLIEPNVGNISIVDLSKNEELIQSGVLATRSAAAELKKVILRRYYEGNDETR